MSESESSPCPNHLLTSIIYKFIAELIGIRSCRNVFDSSFLSFVSLRSSSITSNLEGNYCDLSRGPCPSSRTPHTGDSTRLNALLLLRLQRRLCAAAYALCLLAAIMPRVHVFKGHGPRKELFSPMTTTSNALQAPPPSEHWAQPWPSPQSQTSGPAATDARSTLADRFAPLAVLRRSWTHPIKCSWLWPACSHSAPCAWPYFNASHLTLTRL